MKRRSSEPGSLQRIRHTNAQQNEITHALASTLVERAALAARLGQQEYGGQRDIYEALGYKTTIIFDDYYARYIRQDIAKAIIDRPVRATWQGDLILQESREVNQTPFEKAWIDLDIRLGIKTRLSRVDRLAGIGCYGILLLGLDDVKKLEDFSSPVRPGARKLMYVKPFGEGSARINIFETNPNNPRYGLPLMYNVTIASNETGTTIEATAGVNLITIRVHYTRVIHMVDDILESELLGYPRLECIFNRLMDLEKLVGGDAEMFWRGARPGYGAKLDKDYQVTQDTKDALQAQFDEYEHNLRRILVTEGMDFNALAQQISDPEHHVSIQIDMICAVTGIPKRILCGSERGQLASQQDTAEWSTYVQNRRDEHAEPHIIRPFVKRMLELKILPEPTTGEYSIQWSDLFSMSEIDQVKIGQSRANALKDYTTSPASETVLPPEAFLEFCMGLTQDQINLISEMIQVRMLKEQNKIEENFPVIPSVDNGEGTIAPSKKQSPEKMPSVKKPIPGQINPPQPEITQHIKRKIK